MLRSAVKLLSFTYQRIALRPMPSIIRLTNPQNTFSFSKDGKQETNESHNNKTNDHTENNSKANTE